jgi:hypothetical protein
MNKKVTKEWKDPKIRLEEPNVYPRDQELGLEELLEEKRTNKKMT